MRRAAWILWVLCAACGAGPVVQPRPVTPEAPARARPLDARVDPLDAPRWSAKLPAGWTRWELHLLDEAGVLVAAHKAAKPKGRELFLRVYDPDTQERRWERTLQLSEAATRDELRVSHGWLILSHSAGLEVIDPRTGDTAWTFDPGGRAILDLYIHDRRLYLNLSRQTLGVLDLDAGRWERGISVSDHQLLGVVRGARGPLLLTARLDPKTQRTRLDAIEAEGPGGGEPAPPFAEPQVAWKLDLPSVPRRFAEVDGLLLGLVGGELWAVEPASGEVLYKVPASAPRVELRPLAQDRWIDAQPPARDPHAPVSLDLLFPDLRRLPPGQEAILLEGPFLWSHGTRHTGWLSVRELTAQDPRSLRPLWTAAFGGAGEIQTLRLWPELGAVFVAQRRTAAWVDLERGEALWEVALPQAAQSFSKIDSDGRALYLLYHEGAASRLDVWPLDAP